MGSRLSFTNDKVYVPVHSGPDPFCGDLQLTRTTRKFVQQVDRSLLKRVAHINHLLFNKLKHSHVNRGGGRVKGSIVCPKLTVSGFVKFRPKVLRTFPATTAGLCADSRNANLTEQRPKGFGMRYSFAEGLPNNRMEIGARVFKKKRRVPKKRLDHITNFACLWIGGLALRETHL